ncbi:MAG: hypothetical protein EOO08_04605 [Chitinophagaceae bacterium]|nr:MAG: hypothetical protein EOO08_04605 [Chitinophagaceae bacterium]
MTKKAIGAEEFCDLSDEERLRLLHRDGVYIGKQKVAEQMRVLFQLYGFYVEVFYRHYRREVEQLHVTTDADVLQPYLDQVDVRDLDRKKRESDAAEETEETPE